MDSGTFGRGLVAFVQGLTVLVGDVKALVESDIYKQRLIRCLLHPDYKQALGDFLALDNIYRGLWDLVGQEERDALWRSREQTFKEVRGAVVGSLPFRPDEEWEWTSGGRLWTHLLHLTFSKGSPEEVLKKIG